MKVKCSSCGATLSIGLDVAAAQLARMEIEAECRVKVAQEEASKDVDVARQRRLQAVAKESIRTSEGLSKALAAAQRTDSMIHEAKQKGIHIDPAVVAAVQDLVAKLTVLLGDSA